MRDRRVRLVLVLDKAPVNLVIAAAALHQAGLDIDVVEVLRADDATVSANVYRSTLSRGMANGGHFARASNPATLPPLPLRAANRVRGEFHSRRVRTFGSWTTRPGGVGALHQVDPSRREGFIGVMPNVERVASGRNAYPDDILSDATIAKVDGNGGLGSISPARSGLCLTNAASFGCRRTLST